MQYAYEKLMEAIGILVTEAPLPKRLEHAFNLLARLNDDDFDQDLRGQWAELRSASDRMREMQPDDLRALATRAPRRDQREDRSPCAVPRDDVHELLDERRNRDRRDHH